MIERKNRPVLTAVVGTNADLIAEAARLYLRPEMKVADVTYGKGAFWQKTSYAVLPADRFSPSDLYPTSSYVEKVDCRQLPYPDGTFDAVVFDPPYMHGGGTIKPSIADCYGNNASGNWSHARIVALYGEGIREARRVLKPGGTLWVKCQDEIESGKQHWTHVEILTAAGAADLAAVDLFVLVQKGVPAQRQAKQYHARKAHSYLWIFRKAP